jgi:hypothetical protein
MNEREIRKRRAERYIVIARLILLRERIWPSMAGNGRDRWG